MAAQAQSPEKTLAEQPALIRDAFESDYGKALVAELGKSLRASADPECLKAKGNRTGSDRSARPRHHHQMGHADDGRHRVDRRSKSVCGKIRRHGRTDAAAELERLKQDAAVKRYLAMAQPMRLAKILRFNFRTVRPLRADLRIKTGGRVSACDRQRKAAEQKPDRSHREETGQALRDHQIRRAGSLSRIVRAGDCSDEAAMKKENPAAGASRILQGRRSRPCRDLHRRKTIDAITHLLSLVSAPLPAHRWRKVLAAPAFSQMPAEA